MVFTWWWLPELLRIRLYSTLSIIGSSDQSYFHPLLLRIFGSELHPSTPSSDLRIRATSIRSFIGLSDPSYIFPHSLRIYGYSSDIFIGPSSILEAEDSSDSSSDHLRIQLFGFIRYSSLDCCFFVFNLSDTSESSSSELFFRSIQEDFRFFVNSRM